METISFDLTKRLGAFKPLNAVNGGPWHKRHANDQWRSNLEDYRRARIPYTRNHDANLAGSVYGGPYTVDITAIFPRFEADENDPASYDFACTDESILVPLEAGTKTFFRLGQSIEHQIRKHGTLPPRDFAKWARVCEHIIRHYNEGWANGFRLGIEYWEIWNEPDIDPDDSANKRMWGGTRAQFFDFFETAAKHLKGCFPELRIGGPALCWDEDWADDFLREMNRRGAPLDFFSWHIYTADPRELPEAHKLSAVSYADMLEMAEQGARVLHSRCVSLAQTHGLTFEVCSAFEPLPGTRITAEEARRFCGVAVRRGIRLPRQTQPAAAVSLIGAGCAEEETAIQVLRAMAKLTLLQIARRERSITVYVPETEAVDAARALHYLYLS